MHQCCNNSGYAAEKALQLMCTATESEAENALET